MRRVLKPRGRLLVLEFSQPAPWLRPPYYFYLRAVMPRIGGLITGQTGAYRYLTSSIAQFPDRAALAAEITTAGFAQVQHESLGLGAIALHVAAK
jgi:demethylmenaquinone methyltransferase/2-methoxy-6-polyprenyl-1,4-benzoquinol methylase